MQKLSSGSTYIERFVEFYKLVYITQSMSKAGYTYNSAPLERYFNTLKNGCTNPYSFQTEGQLHQAVEEFAYVTYNHVRPHAYNGYKTPFETRCA